MQGECTAAPPQEFVSGLDPDLLQRRPGQCLVLGNTMLFEVSSASSARVVIDNLYARLEQFTVSEVGVRFMSVSGTSVWFANMTMQGGQGTVEALSVTTNAAVHISGASHPGRRRLRVDLAGRAVPTPVSIPVS